MPGIVIFGKILTGLIQFLCRTLLYHSHNLTKQAAHYLDAPPLPPEDLEPPPEKVEEKPVEPIIETKTTNIGNTDSYGRKKTAMKKRRGSNRMATGPGHSYMVASRCLQNSFLENTEIICDRFTLSCKGCFYNTVLKVDYVYIFREDQ